jgi:Cysteine synthase
MWHDSVLGTIGDTPLVRLNEIGSDLAPTLLAKVEFFNPGGSVKDRIGRALIEAAEEEGDIEPGGTIIEGTSGNTGAGLAITAIAKGYRCIFTTTDKQSPEKVDVLRGLGAEVLVCPTNVEPDDPRSYYSVARRLSEEIPNSIYLNQYDNPANAQAHYETTGPELWEQTDGHITHFVAGAGTGGTISGTSRYLKEQNEAIDVIGVDPRGSVFHKYFHEGVFDEDEIYPYFTEGVGEDILPENMDFDVVDDFVKVNDKAAMQMTRRLAQEEGLFIGQSCGMAVAGTLKWIKAHRDTLSSDDVVVVLLPDSGFRYLSKTYNDDWMQNHGFLEKNPDVTADQVLNIQQGETDVIAAAPDDEIGAVIETMTEQGNLANARPRCRPGGRRQHHRDPHPQRTHRGPGLPQGPRARDHGRPVSGGPRLAAPGSSLRLPGRRCGGRPGRPRPRQPRRLFNSDQERPDQRTRQRRPEQRQRGRVAGPGSPLAFLSLCNALAARCPTLSLLRPPPRRSPLRSRRRAPKTSPPRRCGQVASGCPITTASPKTPKRLTVDVDRDTAEGAYANSVLVRTSPEEVVLDFVRVVPGTMEARLESRVIVPPQNAERLLDALAEHFTPTDGPDATDSSSADSSMGDNNFDPGSLASGNGHASPGRGLRPGPHRGA